jgi:hypothetical protein
MQKILSIYACMNQNKEHRQFTMNNETHTVTAISPSGTPFALVMRATNTLLYSMQAYATPSKFTKAEAERLARCMAMGYQNLTKWEVAA